MDPQKVLEIATGINPELAQRISFIYEIDQLKSVLRQNLLADSSRNENSAEHSWHLAMVALVMAPYAQEPIDLSRVMKILLIHDIVEVDAGDVDIFDTEARKSKAAVEQAAAERIFALLPAEQGNELRELWGEYEARESADARFAYSCDRLQPFLLNLAVGGTAWAQRGVCASDVARVNGQIATDLPAVWPVVEQALAAVVAEGVLQR